MTGIPINDNATCSPAICVIDGYNRAPAIDKAIKGSVLNFLAAVNATANGKNCINPSDAA